MADPSTRSAGRVVPRLKDSRETQQMPSGMPAHHVSSSDPGAGGFMTGRGTPSPAPQGGDARQPQRHDWSTDRRSPGNARRVSTGAGHMTHIPGADLLEEPKMRSSTSQPVHLHSHGFAGSHVPREQPIAMTQPQSGQRGASVGSNGSGTVS